MNDYTLVGLGEILWDILPDAKKLGGAPANFAYHAQALGGKGVVVSCVGNDELGREILERLEQLGLSRDYIAVDKDHPTGTVTVELDEDGKPDYIIHENVAWDFIPADSGLSELAVRADAVCFGSLCQRSDVSRNTVTRFLEDTEPHCIRVFDINLRQSYYNRDVIDRMLGLSTVLKLNDEELGVVAKLLEISGSETDVLAELVEVYRLRLIVVTRGAKGSRLYNPEGDSSHPGFPAKVADTVGAGDAFTAAITLGLLHDLPLDEMSEHANRVAAFVCSQSGATPRMPHSLAIID